MGIVEYLKDGILAFLASESMAHKGGFKTVFSVRKHETLFLEGKIKRYRPLSIPNLIDPKYEKSLLIWFSLTQGK